MEPTVVDVTKLSVAQLKEMCYDRMKAIENNRQELTILEQEIRRKLSMPPAPAAPATEPVAQTPP